MDENTSIICWTGIILFQEGDEEELIIKKLFNKPAFELKALIISLIVHINVFLSCQLDKTTTCTFYSIPIV